MKRIDENQKISLTFGQLKRLVKERSDNSLLEALAKAIAKIIGYQPDGLTMTNDTFAFGGLRFKVDISKESPWRAISVDKPITIQGALGDQFPGTIAGFFLTADKASLQRIVDIFNGLY